MSKGAATILELLMVTSMATVMVGGVTINIQDVLTEATDTQRVANLRQLTVALDLYYTDHDSYPQTSNFESALSELALQGYIGSLPANPELYAYTQTKKGQGYILGTAIENPESSYLTIDIDGILERVDCNDPFYCIKG